MAPCWLLPGINRLLHLLYTKSTLLIIINKRGELDVYNLLYTCGTCIIHLA